MSTDSNEISADIESGKFFEDAHKWYRQKYILPYTERSYFILITIVSVVISIIAGAMFVDAKFRSYKVPVVISVKDTTKQFAEIFPLRNSKTEDSNQVLMKYLLKGYIKAQEEYNYENNFMLLRRNSRFIDQFSTDKLFDRYKNNISSKNPQSMTLRYRKKTKRNIEVNESSFSLEKPGENKHSVTMLFDAYEVTPQFSNSSKWKAKIDFLFSDVKYNRKIKEFLPLEFKVTDYQVTEIK